MEMHRPQGKFQHFFDPVADNTNWRQRYWKERHLTKNWSSDWGHLTIDSEMFKKAEIERKKTIPYEPKKELQLYQTSVRLKHNFLQPIKTDISQINNFKIFNYYVKTPKGSLIQVQKDQIDRLMK